jgi:hypothetical protein
MTLRVTRVPAPAAGADWATTVPGQQAWDIKAVAATLTTVNSRANTNNDNACDIEALSLGAPPGIILPAAAFNPLVGPWSVEFWTAISPSGFGAGTVFASTRTAGAATGNDVDIKVSGLRTIRGGVGATAPTDFIPANPLWAAGGCWHQIVVTCDGPLGTVSFYVDGALAGTQAATNYTLPAIKQNIVGGTFFFGASGNYGGLLDELALYHAVLGAGRVAAHYAAMLVGGATYFDAVMADTPSSYYPIGDVPGQNAIHDFSGNGHNGTRQSTCTLGAQGATQCGAPRWPNLVLTDGTRTVLAAPVATSQVGGSAFRYVWGLNPNLDVGETGVTTVLAGLADVTIPAGFTVGTNTRGITAADQWSNVAVWWDDWNSPDGGGGPRRSPYLNVLILG